MKNDEKLYTIIRKKIFKKMTEKFKTKEKII
jgi:hypothetical protein